MTWIALHQIQMKYTGLLSLLICPEVIKENSMCCRVLFCLLTSFTIVCVSLKLKKKKDICCFCYMLNLLLLLNHVKFDYKEVLKNLFSKGKVYFWTTWFGVAL